MMQDYMYKLYSSNYSIIIINIIHIEFIFIVIFIIHSPSTNHRHLCKQKKSRRNVASSCL